MYFAAMVSKHVRYFQGHLFSFHFRIIELFVFPPTKVFGRGFFDTNRKLLLQYRNALRIEIDGGLITRINIERYENKDRRPYLHTVFETHGTISFGNLNASLKYGNLSSII